MDSLYICIETAVGGTGDPIRFPVPTDPKFVSRLPGALFSVIRWRNGNNNHPDPSQFSSAYKAVVINQLLVPKKVGNVEADISKHIVSNEDVRKLNVVPRQRSRLDSDQQIETHEDFGDPTFDENQKGSINWTTGWACSKLTHAACIKGGSWQRKHSSG